MRHAVVLLLAVSLSGFPATGEMLTPPLGLRSGAVAPAPPAPAVQLPPEIKALTDVEQLLGASAAGPAAAGAALIEVQDGGGRQLRRRASRRPFPGAVSTMRAAPYVAMVVGMALLVVLPYLLLPYFRHASLAHPALDAPHELRRDRVFDVGQAPVVGERRLPAPSDYMIIAVLLLIMGVAVYVIVKRDDPR